MFAFLASLEYQESAHNVLLVTHGMVRTVSAQLDYIW